MEQRLTNAETKSRSEQLDPSCNVTVTENGSCTESTAQPDQSPADIELVEEILGYKFKNKSLLQEAFTDVTFDEKGVSYERLEHVGDSVLNTITTREFYFRYPDFPPGLLTRLRSANVDTEKLARVAIKHCLHRRLRHKKPMLEDQILLYIDSRIFKSHRRISIAFANIVESTIGALFIDCNSIDTVWQVCKPLLEPIIDMETLKINPITELHQLCQKKSMKLRFEDTWDQTKDILVYVEDRLVGRGSHPLKKDSARNIAAKDALDNLPISLDDKST